MKKIILKILVTVVILVGNCLIWVWGSNCVNKQNYMDVSGIVYSKLDNPSTSYKSSKITSDFIMVIKMDNGHMFDLEVTPTTYVTHNVGDRIGFKDIYKGYVYTDYKSSMMFSTLGFLALSVLSLCGIGIIWEAL